MKMRDSIVTLFTVIICITGSVLLNVSMFFGFAIANMALLLYFANKGHSKGELLKAAWTAIKNCRIVYIVIFLMGASIAAWLASGVIPAIIFYGMRLFSPETFLVFSFWICMLVAMIMGTALGTISTVGIALMGIGQGFGLPMPVVLGSIISGAYVSDKLSPISGLVNMNLGISQISYGDFFKRSLKTFIPVVLMSSIFYGVLGLHYGQVNVGTQVEALKIALNTQFHLSAVLFLLPILLIILTARGVKIQVSMTVCILLGSVFAVVFQGFSPLQMADYIVNGFKLGPEAGELQTLLRGGGIFPMLEVLLIVACAVAFSGMIEKTGALEPFMAYVIKPTDNVAVTEVKTGLLSIAFLSIACDQSLAIILPAKSLSQQYKKLGLDQVELSRVIFDTGVMLAPLEFWNVNTIIIKAMTGIGAGAYGMYAILIWLFPAVAFVYAFRPEKHHIKIKRKEENIHEIL